jgi:hypothetical protein
MAKIEIQISIFVDTDEYTEPAPSYEQDGASFVRQIFEEWERYGFGEEPRLVVRCPQLVNPVAYERDVR